MSWSAQALTDLTSALVVGNSKVVGDVIEQAISDNEERRGEQIELHDRYEGDAPIFHRKLKNPDKVNNRLFNDFFGDVVDTKQGYMGNSPTVVLDSEEAAKIEFVQAYLKKNHAEYEMSEAVKDAAICGASGKILYVDGESNVRERRVPGYEVIFIKDATTGRSVYAIRYYTITDEQGVKRYRVEFYDDAQVWYFMQQDSGHYMPDTTRMDLAGNVVTHQLHLFDGVPVLDFRNNDERMGDCEKTLTLMDAYDRTESDANSEIEQLRLAYLYLKGAGMNVDGEWLKTIKQTGVIPLDQDGDVGFITKSLDDDIIEHHLDRLEQNIMRFAKSVDFNSDAFGGQMPIIAFQIKIAGLEHKSKITERIFRAELMRQWEMMTGYWAKAQTITIDPTALSFYFTREIPMNLSEEVTRIAQGRGHVSLETLYKITSFIDDPAAEAERLAAEESIIPGLDEE